ncbi:related to transcription activator protein [Rhynchosporium agropyri]|uniref:Related to transcription activator protein n=1 Tax=Rhynchosporium agropyri TaxID=914238 RepID=A0A1E1KXN5_9HELO|nr:related to transcription activator protein [Rhynchosporium agropyri]
MTQKRPPQDEGNGYSDGHANGTSKANKYARSEDPEKYSTAVKQKLKNSRRAGQACDRCKMRKIKCDAAPGKCINCKQIDSECNVTNRNTGETEPRGYVDQLKEEIEYLKRRCQELEDQVLQAGGNIKPSRGHGRIGSEIQQQRTPSLPAQSSNGSPPQQETDPHQSLLTIRTGTCGSNYLGVSAGNSNLSAIKGTALTILGMEIDIADFISGDMDEPTDSRFNPEFYNKSYQSFLQTMFNINPKLAKPRLPERHIGFEYAKMYFRHLNAYAPLLHSPTFMALLARSYDPTYTPTIAESVMVHMVFAIMIFHFCIRNDLDPAMKSDLNHQSNVHYHYSLSMFFELCCSKTFDDVQAMALICLHLRNFPKPGASWYLTQNTMTLAIELGLHRSAKTWVTEGKPNYLDIEMRKRTFWTLMTVHVTIAGKLGRPMMLRLEDIDVDFPEAMDDELLTEAGLDTSSTPGVCKHAIGLAAMRMIPLFLELYTTIYAVKRSPENYVTTVESLETKINAWKQELPTHLQSQNQPKGTSSELRISALYADMWVLELRLLLRHPSVEMTDDKAFKAESMRACADCASEMLNVVLELRDLNGLDTTWYNAAVYVMAITTTLFATHDKKAATQSEINVLKTDMHKWLAVMGDVGRLLGSGDSLKTAVHSVIVGTLGMLEARVTRPAMTYHQNSNPIGQSTASQRCNSEAYTALPNPAPEYRRPFQEQPPAHGPSRVAASSTAYLQSSSPPEVKVPLRKTDSGMGYDNITNAALESNHQLHSQVNTDYSRGQMDHHSTAYTPTQYSPYSEPPPTITYTPRESVRSYTNYSDDAAPLTDFALAASQIQTNGVSHWQPVPGKQQWQQFTHNLAGNFAPQDRYSASTLMSLSGRVNDLPIVDNGVGVQSGMPDMVSVKGDVAFGQLQINGHLTGELPVWPPQAGLYPFSASGMGQGSVGGMGRDPGPGAG